MFSDMDKKAVEEDVKRLARTRAMMCNTCPEDTEEVMEFIMKKADEYEKRYEKMSPTAIMFELLSEAGEALEGVFGGKK